MTRAASLLGWVLGATLAMGGNLSAQDYPNRTVRIIVPFAAGGSADAVPRVVADWLTRNREWYRAVWIECAELMDHYGGWKWWKASRCDVEQVMLEIVDIWHFGLSMRITPARDFEAAAARIAARNPLKSSKPRRRKKRAALAFETCACCANSVAE